MSEITPEIKFIALLVYALFHLGYFIKLIGSLLSAPSLQNNYNDFPFCVCMHTGQNLENPA